MTTVPTVKAALVTVLADVDAQVIYGPASSVTVTKPDVLSVGRVRGTQEFQSLDMSSGTESYVVDCEATSSVAGVSQQSADETALAIFDAARLLVNAHFFGDGVVVKCMSDFELDEKADGNGRHAIVRFSVRVTANL